jgi:hypothetical protein
MVGLRPMGVEQRAGVTTVSWPALCLPDAHIVATTVAMFNYARLGRFITIRSGSEVAGMGAGQPVSNAFPERSCTVCIRQALCRPSMTGGAGGGRVVDGRAKPGHDTVATTVPHAPFISCHMPHSFNAYGAF